MAEDMTGAGRLSNGDPENGNNFLILVCLLPEDLGVVGGCSGTASCSRVAFCDRFGARG